MEPAAGPTEVNPIVFSTSDVTGLTARHVAAAIATAAAATAATLTICVAKQSQNIQWTSQYLDSKINCWNSKSLC